MSIPLSTYDPNWVQRHEAASILLDEANKEPFDPVDNRYMQELLDNLHDAFHAQFRTTGDYAQYMQQRAESYAASQGMDEFKVPMFSDTASVEVTQRLYSTVVGRINIQAASLRNMLGLSYPQKGEAFAFDLGAEETRTVNSETFMGFHEEAAYSYMIEKRAGKINVCFFQTGSGGTSPTNCIESLATQLYDRHFSPVAMTKGGAYVSPAKFNFYIYVPPLVFGDEQFSQVGLSWNEKRMAFESPAWNHFLEVPYILRKQAALDNLAFDPDTPKKPEGGQHPASPAGFDTLK